MFLKSNQRLKKDKFDVDFSSQPIRGKNSVGVIISRHPLKKIEFKKEGVSTLSARKIWFDNTVLRLNADGRGEFLGDFQGDDRIVTINSRGFLSLNGLKLSNHFDEDLLLIKKCDFEKIINIIYYNNNKESYYLKRFLVPETSKSIFLLPDGNSCFLENISDYNNVSVEITYKKEKGKDRVIENIKLDNFVVSGYKSIGKRLSVMSKEKINDIKFTSVNDEIDDKGESSDFSIQMRLDI